MSETTEETPEVVARYGYTYGRATGNRVVDGPGSLDRSVPVDVPLEGVPEWVVGVPFEGSVAWVVALGDGTLSALRVDEDGEVVPVGLEGRRSLSPGEPPVAESAGSTLRVVGSRNGPGSDLTHPVPAASGYDVLGVEDDGEVFAEKSSRDNVAISDLQVDALPDARVVRSEKGTFALLTDPTEEYPHGVLGDGIEAKSITVFDDLSSGAGRTVLPQSGGVFEGISPLWFEDEDGRELLAVTESVDGFGSRVAVYSSDGSLVGAGPFVGEPLKWRHVLAVGPFGPEGELEVAATRTPHLDPSIQFYRFDGETLEVSGEAPGYTSHRIYTRNLDTATSGDLDGDGRWELLVPNEDYTGLAAIRRGEDGAYVAWGLDVGGEAATNIGSATGAGGRASVAVGRTDGTLRIWR